MDRSHITVETALSLQGVSKIYQENVAVDQINVDLVKGEFLSLLGPSGSGKTTLLRMIAGLITPDKGSIQLHDKDISKIPPNLRNFGMVFQQYALFPHMTVWDNVAYGLKARKMDKQLIKSKVDHYLELVDLKHLSKRKPKELSGGQQQRVSLARALAIEPTLMLFDEPLSNLDVRLKEQMLREIRKLHKTIGFTAIYVTHDQNEALYLSDKIAVLSKGRMEQFGTPEDILSTPTSPFVADFFGYTNKLKDAQLIDNKNARLGDLTIPIGHIPPGCQPGDYGSVFLRPNSIKIPELLIEDKEIRKKMAEVVDSRFLGGVTEVKLKLMHQTNQEFSALIPKIIKPQPKVGTAVSLTFDPDSIVFFPNGKGEM